MDTLFERFYVPMERFTVGQGSNQNLGNHESTNPIFLPTNLDHNHSDSSSSQNLVNGFQVNHEPTNTLFLPPNSDHPSESEFSSSGSDGDTFDISVCNHPVLKYISDILLEEDLEGKPCMLQDCLALQAAEKSFYDVLKPKGPSSSQSPLPVDRSFENSDDDFKESCHISIGCVAARTDSVSGSEISHIQSCPVESSSDAYNSTYRLKSKKNHLREDGDYTEEGRSNKQSAASADGPEPQEMFDEVLLYKDARRAFESCSDDQSVKTDGSGKLKCNKQPKVSKAARSKTKNKNREVVDLCTMLTQCAQAVASYDQQTASELIKKIRKHSSPYGEATERLAYYFANALEARLAGSRTPSYSPLLSPQTPATEILKAHQVYITSCPFMKMMYFFANRTIMKLAENATRLHIIDFGISYGFQWPCLIQRLSERCGGPPNLRITAIELPQPGFRPTERVEETMRRLEKYAKRFVVPFEYNVIAQKWETIRFEDLKVDRNELTVVNCMRRLRHIPDETVVMSSPRDTVLNLIKKINPDLFIHGVVNGTYNSPFFVKRFREALFHYSSLFDMFEATIPREDEHRLMFEGAVYGRDIMNVIACEGIERVERPETYKHWQVRYQRAGFKQVPLDQELMRKVKAMLKLMRYHNDFRIDEDGHWMLQGWKGRIVMALSALKPA
ncbi:hypothetical protein ACFX2G_006280 [Malus domestica]